MKGDSSYVVVVSLEDHDRAWVRTLDVVEPNDMPTGGSEVFLVGSYA